MEVIFIKDLKGQGKVGEIKIVKDGYANNFLIKNGYAVKKTDNSIKSFEKQKENEIKLDKEKESAALKLKKILEAKPLKFQVKTGAEDKVFGSVSIKQIKEELDKIYNINIDKKIINLSSPITSLGDHKVELNLHRSVKAIVNIQVIK